MKEVQTYFKEMKNLLDRVPREPIGEVIDLLEEVRIEEKMVFILGNGGSASTASHFVCDLAKNTRRQELPDFRVIGLADNMEILTAYANDEGFGSVFAGQLAPLVREGDVVVGISTSGKSENVLKAIELANERGATTIGFTGFSGGKLKDMVDISVHVPSKTIERVEDAHLMIEHVITMALRERN